MNIGKEGRMNRQFTVQVKVAAIIDIPFYGKDVESALEEGRGLKWEDIMADSVSVAEGQYELVGAFDSKWFNIKLPNTDGLVIKSKSEGSNKIVTMFFSKLERTIAIWKQALED